MIADTAHDRDRVPATPPRSITYITALIALCGGSGRGGRAGHSSPAAVYHVSPSASCAAAGRASLSITVSSRLIGRLSLRSLQTGRLGRRQHGGGGTVPAAWRRRSAAGRGPGQTGRRGRRVTGDTGAPTLPACLPATADRSDGPSPSQLRPVSFPAPWPATVRDSRQGPVTRRAAPLAVIDASQTAGRGARRHTSR